VVATGSAGTQAGLVVGAKALGNQTKIVGISVSGDKASIQRNVAEIANATAAALDLQITFTPNEVIVFDDYVGQGYGILNQPTADAIAQVARQEGILLDPVYTGKAMAGTIDLMRKGHFKSDEGVVFMHTGGTPALFPHRDDLLAFLKGGTP
jgi:L-cysteate sulfo-lyase